MTIYENSFQGWRIYITATGRPGDINKRKPESVGGDGLGFGGLRGAWAGKLFIYFEVRLLRLIVPTPQDQRHSKH